VLTRQVYEDLETQERANRGEPVSDNGVVMHGGFYLGPQDFYQQLRELEEQDRARISMTSVNFINDLYDHRFGSQKLKAAQRRHARFINSAMMHTLSGAAVSDGLDDGRVVSGVGGQYNFVAMAHDLPGARSVITLRSTRSSGGQTLSNIVFGYGHCTIPRHLRDVVITEYGLADLRGKPDEEVYLGLIRIADARFQPDLLQQAKAAGKVRRDFELPASWRDNTPDHVREALSSVGDGDAFPAFPFGCDFTEEELVLAKALQSLKSATADTRGKLRTFARAARVDTRRADLKPWFERMGLASGRGPRTRLNRRLLAVALEQSGGLKSSGEAVN
jgi:acyl-CoA hydrolase